MGHNLDYITDAIGKVAQDTQLFQLRGNVLKVTGALIRASVPNAKIGELCILSNPARLPAFGVQRTAETHGARRQFGQGFHYRTLHSAGGG